MQRLFMCGLLLAAFHTSHSNLQEFCSLPSEEGTGQIRETFVHYDSTDDNCYPFMYKGEGGNQNRFSNEKECMRNCSSQGNALYPVDERTACHLPLAKGSVCTANALRFRYDSIHDKCKPFFWKGCVGNGNRFLSYQQCNETCNGVHDDGDALEDEEHDTPIGIICIVLVVVIFAIVIIVAIVLVVKSKNASQTKNPKKPRREDAPLQESAIEMK